MIILMQEILEDKNKFNEIMKQERDLTNFSLTFQKNSKNILLDTMQKFAESNEDIDSEFSDEIIKLLEGLKNSLLLCNENITLLNNLIRLFDSIKLDDLNSEINYNNISSFNKTFFETNELVANSTLQIQETLNSILNFSVFSFEKPEDIPEKEADVVSNVDNFYNELIEDNQFISSVPKSTENSVAVYNKPEPREDFVPITETTEISATSYDMPETIEEPISTFDTHETIEEPVPTFDMHETTEEPVHVYDIPETTEEPVPTYDIPETTEEPVPVYDAPEHIEDSIPTYKMPEAAKNSYSANNIPETILSNSIHPENTLVISEQKGKVFLPYFAKEVQAMLDYNPNKYSNVEDIIEKEYTIPIEQFKNPAISRFKEAFKLVKYKEQQSTKEAFDLGMELLFSYNLHPAIIAGCRNLDELDIYLDCLEYNETDKFDCFKIKFEMPPMAIKGKKRS